MRFEKMDGEEYNICPYNGTYLNEKLNICEKCIANCAECLSLTKCNQCKAGFYLYTNESDMHSPDKCILCDQKGEVRIRPWIKGPKCLIDQSIIYIYIYICVLECPEGSFYNKKWNNCKFCGSGCKKCSKEGECMECQEDMKRGIVEAEDISNNHFYCVLSCEGHGEIYIDENVKEYCKLKGIVEDREEEHIEGKDSLSI